MPKRRRRETVTNLLAEFSEDVIQGQGHLYKNYLKRIRGGAQEAGALATDERYAIGAGGGSVAPEGSQKTGGSPERKGVIRRRGKT